MTYYIIRMTTDISLMSDFGYQSSRFYLITLISKNSVIYPPFINSSLG